MVNEKTQITIRYETVRSTIEDPERDAIINPFIKEKIETKANEKYFKRRWFGGKGVLLSFGSVPISVQSKNKKKNFKKDIRSTLSGSKFKNAKDLFKDKELEMHLIFFLTRNYKTRDLDNFVKPIIDAMKGYIYEDDGQICKTITEKVEVTEYDQTKDKRFFEQIACWVFIK